MRITTYSRGSLAMLDRAKRIAVWLLKAAVVIVALLAVGRVLDRIGWGGECVEYSRWENC